MHASIANAQGSRIQRRNAVIATVSLIVVCGALLPFARRAFPAVPGMPPVFLTFSLCLAAISAFTISTQYTSSRSRALLGPGLRVCVHRADGRPGALHRARALGRARTRPRALRSSSASSPKPSSISTSAGTSTPRPARRRSRRRAPSSSRPSSRCVWSSSCSSRRRSRSGRGAFRRWLDVGGTAALDGIALRRDRRDAALPALRFDPHQLARSSR